MVNRDSVRQLLLLCLDSSMVIGVHGKIGARVVLLVVMESDVGNAFVTVQNHIMAVITVKEPKPTMIYATRTHVHLQLTGDKNNVMLSNCRTIGTAQKRLNSELIGPQNAPSVVLTLCDLG